ncbi:MAG: hypothetical protein BWY68_00313 [bacterium ADurb.Bin400]|nr:MAG: hypothetical protein BWY68_00313 [bacterium ADurb.Bin400]
MLARKVHKLRELYDSSYALLQPKRIAWPLIIAVISWGFEAIAFYLVFQAFDLNGSVMAAVFIYSFSTIVGAVSMLPGGLGMTEGLIAGLMKMLEIDTAVAALSTVIIRLATLWFAVVIGLAFLLMAEKRFGANVTDLMLEQEV